MSVFQRTTLWLSASFLLSICAHGEPIRVRHPQGSTHGFAVLKTLDGVRIATGDLTQTVSGGRVFSRLTFKFRDGSIDDDATVFTQRGTFRLLSDHHIQKGPSFPQPIDVMINAITGEVTSRDEQGTITTDHIDLPADVSNGLPPNLLMNVLPGAAETKISYLAPRKKPRLVHLSIKNAGNVPFTVGDTKRQAIDYVVHIELGGVTGVVAPMLGKQPPDTHIWILGGSSPAFIREEGSLYEGGPIWRIEQISPTF